MSYILFLDDIREIDKDVKLPVCDFLERKTAINYEKFVEIINTFGLPDVISFDFDLCPDHYQIGARNHFMSLVGYEKCNIPTGLDCAKFLINHCQKNKLQLPICYSHSQNLAGQRAIVELIKKYKEKYAPQD